MNKIATNQKLRSVLVYCVALSCLSIPAFAGSDNKQFHDTSAPAQVEADTMNYLTEESKVTASGNVEITQGDKKLYADEVIYDQKKQLITSNGSIRLEDANGNIFRADKAELADSLDRGIIQNIDGELAGKSHIAASQAELLSKDSLELADFFFTPCNFCKRSGKPPLWNIRADKVKIDDKEESIYYKNATFEVMDIPIFYTPYFAHATPDAKKKSGILVPTYMGSNVLGASVKVPYYVNIAPNMDATIAPIFTTEEGIVMSGEFRHLTDKGQYEIEGSITNPEERDVAGNIISGRDLRGHIEGSGEFVLENNWTAGFDAKRSTDDTYLRRYEFGGEDLLTSRVYAERIKGRNYVGIEGLSFQGLNADDDPGTTPFVLPLIDTHYERKAGYRDSVFSLDSNAMLLARSEGADSRRLSSTGSWKLPHTTDNGHVFEFSSSVRGDVYHVADVIDPLDPANDEEGFTGRIIPEGKVSWAYPLMQENSFSRIMVEPLADVIISPHGSNPSKIPNEDSQELEISDFNLFSSHHHTGLDRVEGGPRANYGVRGGVYKKDSDANINFLLGQNYRTKKDENFTVGSGMDDNFSDYVARIGITDGHLLNAVYRTRVDKDDFAFRRNEVNAWMNLNPLHIAAGYVRLDDEIALDAREEAISAATLNLDDNWSLQANGRRDLSSDGGWISSGASLIFENECITVTTAFNREYTRDRDIEPSTSLSLKISFKELGI